DDRTDEELAEELAEAEARGANLAVARRPFREAVVQRNGGRADLALAGFVGGLPAVESLLSRWGLVSGVDFWRLDPLGPGLPTTGEQIARAREAREAKAARLRAADAVPPSRTTVEWGAIQERRRAAQEKADQAREAAARLGRDDDQEHAIEGREAAYERFRQRLREAKARQGAVTVTAS
ncbi:hypothetical protein, partial [Streptomyces sp. NPDC012510]|uniref:hypothetical protein n=1 Tax=Streptomyces sp. NPDC012510 TaxID=3364838 RepID=UPI0036EEC145